jgi:hypothetical protein
MGPRSFPALAFGLMVLWGAGEAQVAIEPRARPAPPEPPSPKASLRADANLVLIPVTVCDPLNRPVTGLDREHFRVFDDSVEQTVTQFAMDDEPVAVGLVFDTSGSMQPRMRLARKAAGAFFSTGNAGDEFLWWSSTTSLAWRCRSHATPSRSRTGSPSPPRTGAPRCSMPLCSPCTR